MFGIGPWELVGILAIVLIIFGPGKLPDAVRSVGKSIKEFRDAATDIPNQAEVTAEKQK